MTRVELATKDFLKYRQEIEKIHRKAFTGFPWYLDDSQGNITQELAENMHKPGTEVLLAYSTQKKIVGVLIYDTPSLEELAKERGETLCHFTEQLLKTDNISAFVWEREVFVDPEFYRKGVATDLRRSFIKQLQNTYRDGVIILTRMWDKNPGIIRLAEKLQFQRTGIKDRSRKIDAEYEYWYRIVASRS